MHRILRTDREGVASTIATMFTLLVILLFIQVALVAVVPAQQYDAEWNTSLQAVDAFERIRAFSHVPVQPPATFSATIPIGTEFVSPFAFPSPGALRFNSPDPTEIVVSFEFIPHFNEGNVTKIDQDVVLLMDSSGSMTSNDPQNLRITGAKEYVGQLEYPDRVAIVDFDGCVRLTRQTCSSSSSQGVLSGPAHHLDTLSHNGIPDYREAQSDLDLINSAGNTNFGDAMRLGVDELITYGHPDHTWIIILLTDGQNCLPGECPSQRLDDLARTQAFLAAQYGIVVYTIGLGPSSGLNEPLLRQIASITGGKYFHASNAGAIRWIYFEISRAYQGAFQCGRFVAQETAFGALSLDLQPHEYSRQTLRFEGGAVSVIQPDGAALRQGLPFDYRPNELGSAFFSLTLVSMIGEPFDVTGTTFEIVQGRILARDAIEQRMVTVDLLSEGLALKGIADEFQFWTNERAATQNASNAVRAPLLQAQRYLQYGDANASIGQLDNAKFNLDRAEAQLQIAIFTVQNQPPGEVQPFLVNQTRDDILVSICKLSQWVNWYNGVTITVRSSTAEAWARWFVETFRGVGAGVSVTVANGEMSASIRAIDHFILDRRVIELTLGG